MNAGLMNRLVVLQAPPATKDEGGELIGDWTVVASVWAYIKDQSATETQDDKSQVMTTVRSFTIRHRSGITNAMRILHENNYWQITGIIEKSRTGYLELITNLKSNW
jgi:SPP1 family predicted phage head-tail adaptor